MRYGKVSGVDNRVSRLVQGSTVLSSKEPDRSLALLDAVFQAGCNTFDCGHIYAGGDCERVLGRWISDRQLRDKVVILDKGAHHNADRRRVTSFDIASDLHDSLARLRTDYIDLYMLHRDDQSVPVGPIVEALNEHLASGRIRAFGGSNWTHERTAQANDYAASRGLVGFVASSPQFSLVEQVHEPWADCVTITGEDGAPARQWYAANSMPLFCWSSLAGGFLSGRYTRAIVESMTQEQKAKDACIICYGNQDNLKRLDRAETLARAKGASVPQMAIAYLMAQPLNTFALVGARTAEEFRDCAKGLEITLTAQEVAFLDLTRQEV
jgi:aryl-alcohol dehydrogenase-like predicted oxidoreductase